MEENPDYYSTLINRLKSGNPSTFRNDLELLAQNFGTIRPLEDVAKLASENEELLRIILELIKKHGQRDKLGMISFHSTRWIGPKAIPNIREEWQRNREAEGIHYLNMCLTDICGASSNEDEWRTTMPIIAEQETPLWIEMLKGTETKSRGLIACALGELAYHAPAQIGRAGEAIISLLSGNDLSIQRYAVRGLLSICDKSLLQEALFQIARAVYDESSLEYLLYSATAEIDLNAKDSLGKSALTYAQESGNEKIAAILKKAGASNG